MHAIFLFPILLPVPMQKILSFSSTLCAILAFIFFFNTFAMAAVVDKSVAVVNNDTITLSEVNEIGKPIFDKIKASTPADRQNEALEQARAAIINRLIDKYLVSQEAEKNHIKVSDAELEGALAQLLKNQNMSTDDFQKDLKEIGLSERQYREELRQQLLSTKLINQVIRAKIVIPEEEILAQYGHQTGKNTESGSYNLLQIGCKWGEVGKDGKTLTQEQAKIKADEAHKQALQGSDFSTLAQKYSDLPTADDGGKLGNFHYDELAADIRDAVGNLSVGAISPVVEIGQSYLFFKRIGMPSQEVKQTGDESTANSTENTDKLDPVERAKIHQQLFEKAMDEKLQIWIKELRSKAYIQIL